MIEPRHRASLSQIVQTPIPMDALEDEKDRLARRQANAILMLLKLGEEDLLWPPLCHSPDPRVRSFLIDHLGQVLEQPEQLLRRLDQEKDPGAAGDHFDAGERGVDKPGDLAIPGAGREAVKRLSL